MSSPWEILDPGQVSSGWFDNSSFHGEVTINMSGVYRHLDFSRSENYILASFCVPFFPYMSLITSSSWYRFGDFTLAQGANIFLHIFLSLVPCETQIAFDLGFFNKLFFIIFILTGLAFIGIMHSNFSISSGFPGSYPLHWFRDDYYDLHKLCWFR